MANQRRLTGLDRMKQLHQWDADITLEYDWYTSKKCNKYTKKGDYLAIVRYSCGRASSFYVDIRKDNMPIPQKSGFTTGSERMAQASAERILNELTKDEQVTVKPKGTYQPYPNSKIISVTQTYQTGPHRTIVWEDQNGTQRTHGTGIEDYIPTAGETRTVIIYTQPGGREFFSSEGYT